MACPVCPDARMSVISVGRDAGVAVDLCRRCGGIWLDRGEAVRLRALGRNVADAHLRSWKPPGAARCRSCGTSVSRDEPQCAACGADQILDCPVCGRAMEVATELGLRVDVCRSCHGAWLDHHELAALWDPLIASSLASRSRSGRSGVGEAAEATGDMLFQCAIYDPELLEAGASMASGIVSGGARVVAALPDAALLGPEVVADAMGAVTEAAAGVLEVVGEIVGGLLQ